MEKVYAQALFREAQKEGADAKTLVSRLAAHLERVGRRKLLPGILREFKRIGAQAEKLMPTVEVAHQKDAAQALTEAAAHGIHAAHAHVNHDLIHGWRASGNGKTVDASAKAALVRLYQNITTH